MEERNYMSHWGVTFRVDITWFFKWANNLSTHFTKQWRHTMGKITQKVAWHFTNNSNVALICISSWLMIVGLKTNTCTESGGRKWKVGKSHIYRSTWTTLGAAAGAQPRRGCRGHLRSSSSHLGHVWRGHPGCGSRAVPGMAGTILHPDHGHSLMTAYMYEYSENGQCV